ncbi:hypothetical protein DesLBE_3775 [Desulfitobacterium sp. LBE]|uniref:hypothetical protein n=1 Tax=Desulfitobacterium sp. LBE TaxID=884086 RepID=UPI00119ADAF4|nr:hypothetical protein [Desulfitobacterium sp. LBE]TWH59396.1 hypothetical protein DesLBE_3775 [Desulfitobacterium sp. LBE]
MNKFGIEINKLVLQGAGKQDALLTFEKGLNVVAGASDSGKSFAYECINFIFGSTDIPEIPNEAIGYESVFLEFFDKAAKQKITLKRSLKESEKNNIFYIYSDIDHLVEANYEVLSNDSKAKNSLSSKLLALFNCHYRNVLKKTSNGETEAFTFRKFVYLMMLNESRIVQKNSPIYMGDTRRDKTSSKEVATFFAILSGFDYQKHVKLESAEVKKAQLKGAVDELSLICNNLRVEIAETENLIQGYNTDQINERIANLDSFIKEQRLIVVKHEEERERSVQRLNSLANEKSRIADNLSKFRLLKKNYQSDIDRLEFIEQSHDYTGQLAEMKCPICNTTMKSTNVDKEIYYIAIDKEKSKLNTHLTDLQETIEDFECDLTEISKSIVEEQSKVKYIENILDEQANKISKTVLDYENYLKIRDKAVEIQKNRKKLYDTTARIEELSERIDNTKSVTNKVEIKRLTDELMLEFCKLIQVLLEDWSFITKTKEQQVIFERKSNDVVVCNKTKASYGKGARAIINSAFIISIMKYCVERGLSHPGFVVLDSPLTTYKEKDRKQNAKNEEVDKSVKDSFFYSLSRECNDYQIIIFDNELPPNDLTNITYHHFTGNPEIDRTGFIPN